MAECGAPNLDPRGEENWEKIKKVRRLRELFHGRFPDKQCATLLKHFHWDINLTVTCILDDTAQNIREILSEDEWQVVGARRDNVLRDLARRNAVGAEVRQFGCKGCDNMWWRRVPCRKPVARCKVCGRRFDPIPRDQEWGWAKFQCDCSNEYKICEPIEILPPLRGTRSKRRRYTHRCTAQNCYNRCPPYPNVPVIRICVHPMSLQKKVYGSGSDGHVSTGSTVKTFLTQDDLMPPYSPYEPSLADVSEDSGDDDNQ